MSQVSLTATSVINYADISYKGFQRTAESKYTSQESTIYGSNTVENSVQEFPFGPNFIYLEGKTSIRIRLEWSIFSGFLYLYFYSKNDENYTKIENFFISTGEPIATTIDLRMDIPEGIEYVRFENPTYSTCSIRNASITGITLDTSVQSVFAINGIDAVKNAIKLYLFSRKGDYGRKLTKGGPLDFILGKPVTELTTSLIDTTIREAIKDFYTLELSDLVIIPDKAGMKYHITMYISDEYNKYLTPLTFTLS